MLLDTTRRMAARCLVACLAMLSAGHLCLAQAQSVAAAPADQAHECIIEPEQVVKLASPVVGVVARLDVDRGDIVRKGQILGKLEDAVETASLDLARARATNESPTKSAEARLHFLQRKHSRVDALHMKSISSLAALQEAEAEKNVAEQQLKEAVLNTEIARLEVRHIEEVVNQRTLRSPFNGVVVERLLLPGEYRNEQTPILTLAQIDRLRVEVFVPTALYGSIVVGSRAEVRPEPPIGGTFAAAVTVVDRVLDAASGTYGVRLALANPDLVLPAGIRCKVVFQHTAVAQSASTKDGLLQKNEPAGRRASAGPQARKEAAGAAEAATGRKTTVAPEEKLVEEPRVAALPESRQRSEDARRKKDEAGRKDAREGGAKPSEQDSLSPDPENRGAARTPRFAGTVSEEERTILLRRVQDVLNRSSCYDGTIDEDIDRAQDGLNRLIEAADKSAKVKLARLELAKASAADFKTWLANAAAVRDNLCRPMAMPVEARSPGPMPSKPQTVEQVTPMPGTNARRHRTEPRPSASRTPLPPGSMGLILGIGH